jgi:hypothetical protein
MGKREGEKFGKIAPGFISDLKKQKTKLGYCNIYLKK